MTVWKMQDDIISWKMFIASRKLAKILAVSHKSHNLSEALLITSLCIIVPENYIPSNQSEWRKFFRNIEQQVTLLSWTFVFGKSWVF